MVGLEWYPCCRLQPATRIHGTRYSATITMLHGPVNIRLTIRSSARRVVLYEVMQLFSWLFYKSIISIPLHKLCRRRMPLSRIPVFLMALLYLNYFVNTLLQGKAARV